MPADRPAASPPRPGVRVVLLQPKRGANVGAACRAIKNMGAGDLVLVGGDYDPDEARRTSVHAGDVFEARREAGDFAEAVADCTTVIGTTSRQQPWKLPVEEIGLVFADTRRDDESRAALVFGPEERGLSNEELARCHRLAYVPTAGDYASLNLAQAVVVCLYEWSRARAIPIADAPAGPGAVAAREQAAVVEDWRRALVEIGFLDGDQAERVMASVASILTRSGLDEREARILRGIARQMRWAAGRGDRR